MPAIRSTFYRTTPRMPANPAAAAAASGVKMLSITQIVGTVAAGTFVSCCVGCVASKAFFTKNHMAYYRDKAPTQ